MRQPKIGVFPARQFVSRQRVLQALGQLYSVEFAACQHLDRDCCDAAVLFGVTREEAIHAAGSGLRCMAFLDGETAAVTAPVKISLSQTCYLSKCERGQLLAHKPLGSICRIK